MEGFLYCLIFASLCNQFSHALDEDKKCPNVEAIEYFNLSSFGQGVWYELARYPNEFETTNCGSYEAILTEDKTKVQFINSLNMTEASPDYFSDIIGYAPGSSNKGILLHELSFGNPRVDVQFYEYVQAFDADKYFISYCCQYDEKTKTIIEYSWVATRTRNVGSELKAVLDNHIKSSKYLDANKFIWIDLQNMSC